ncbi:hypothetical protein J7T55_001099 [Diaporthe amygdali]|uniref:uncharacterized protein n=1 Tax=Phomopsis amygdali TaxID=1214568 RepID=UPI0022FDDD1D|nr:uncharacterized protein J7T55_001099 [Diaporthe amygdali]KAJ0120242.1 hypothetical protein J7T55_001099 [Diaporthe amygdali]
MAPPSTPAQSRFLHPKKKTQVPQAERQVPLSLHNGPRQFASTPRFNTSATPRPLSHQPPPFSTPVPSSARPRPTPHETLSDVIDTSPISPDEPGNDGEDRIRLDESIEIDSPSASRTPSRQFQTSRPAKRRRVSLSPEIEASPDADQLDVFMEDDEQAEISSTPVLDDRIAVQSSFDQGAYAAGSRPQSPRSADEQAPRNPTFQSAPRFKASETTTETQHRPLPEAFSPQRRGAKYVAGGLAAEVRDWLVQVKGASEYDRPTGSSIDVVVDEAMSAPGMHVIAARLPDAGNESDAVPGKVILAGDGRVAELRGKSIVRRSGVVSMSQPMWDISLGDLGQFAVACDWEARGT